MASNTPGFKEPKLRAQRPRRDWMRAFRGLRSLAKDKEDTAQVFEVYRALNGNSSFRGYVRLLDTPEGGRLAYERLELAEKLLNPEWVGTFPPGSVGAAYLEYLSSEHLSTQGLIDESHKGLPSTEWDPLHPYAWFDRRLRDLHDVWHVLTGYGRDHLGEVCLLAFTYQETHALGRAIIVAIARLRARGPAAGLARKAIAEARRRARQVAWLPGEDYEQLLFEPLEDVRHRLGLTPPVAYLAVPPNQRDFAVD